MKKGVVGCSSHEERVCGMNLEAVMKRVCGYWVSSDKTNPNNLLF